MHFDEFILTIGFERIRTPLVPTLSSTRRLLGLQRRDFTREIQHQ